MSNVIDFLERMGRDARLRHASPIDIEQALLRAEVDPEVQAAILARDQSRLETLVGGSNICCYIDPAIVEEEKTSKDPAKKRGGSSSESNDEETSPLEKSA